MKKNHFYINHIIICLIIFLSISNTYCKKKKIKPIEIETYIFISHTRTNENPLLNPIVEQKDFLKFDMRILGGDIAALS